MCFASTIACVFRIVSFHQPPLSSGEHGQQLLSIHSPPSHTLSSPHHRTHVCVCVVLCLSCDTAGEKLFRVPRESKPRAHQPSSTFTIRKYFIIEAPSSEGSHPAALRTARERQIEMGVPEGLMRALDPWLGRLFDPHIIYD